MEATRPLAPNLQRPPDMGLDFDLEERTQPAPRPQPPATPVPPMPFFRPVAGPVAGDSLRMDLDDLGGATVRSAVTPLAGGDTTLDFREFNVSEPGALPDVSPTTRSGLDDLDVDGDPLARKLELADEFRQIGDMEGARDLLEEVVAKAGGTLRAKAQAMLDALT